jgi:hypothetical protein
MAEQTVYCEECVEEIPSSEVYWDDGRLYCRRCGSEVESPDRDIFEEIVDNRSGFLFRDADPPDEDTEEEEEPKQPLEPEAAKAAGDEDGEAAAEPDLAADKAEDEEADEEPDEEPDEDAAEARPGRQGELLRDMDD